MNQTHQMDQIIHKNQQKVNQVVKIQITLIVVAVKVVAVAVVKVVIQIQKVVKRQIILD